MSAADRPLPRPARVGAWPASWHRGGALYDLPVRRFADFQGEIYRAGLSGSRPDLPMTAAGLERAAREAMAPEVYDYVAGSAGTESTAAANRGAFLRWEIVPRQLRGSGQPSLA